MLIECSKVTFKSASLEEATYEGALKVGFVPGFIIIMEADNASFIKSDEIIIGDLNGVVGVEGVS